MSRDGMSVEKEHQLDVLDVRITNCECGSVHFMDERSRASHFRKIHHMI